MTPRFFLAHAKSDDDDRLDQLISSLSGLLDKLSHGKPFDLTLGRAYFEERFKAAGSWEAWALEIAQGVDPILRTPLFTAIFVPAGPVGAATARIVEFAVRGAPPRPVFTFDLEGRSARVVGVKKVADSWQVGWRLATDRALS
jgi:hypothetical protein